MRRSAIRFLAALAATSLLGGCGFQLRGETTLPFTAAYVDAPKGSALGDGLRQSLSGLKKLTEKRDDAPVVIRITHENRTKNILSLTGSGKVGEYRLEYLVDLSAFAASGTELIPPARIHLTRDYTYDDNKVLAKEIEEAALNRSMEEDALRQTLRRLSYIKP